MLPVVFHLQHDVFEDVDPTRTQRETIQNMLGNCLGIIKYFSYAKKLRENYKSLPELFNVCRQEMEMHFKFRRARHAAENASNEI